MSIQLFLSLVKYFNKQFSANIATTAPANGADAKDITGIFNVTTALQLLELELPNLLFIFELLASSAAAHHSVDGVVITSRDQFIDQLRLINITLTQENLSKLFTFFDKNGISYANKDDVHVDYIVQVLTHLYSLTHTHSLTCTHSLTSLLTHSLHSTWLINLKFSSFRMTSPLSS